jgi:hypothetical protein
LEVTRWWLLLLVGCQQGVAMSPAEPPESQAPIIPIEESLHQLEVDELPQHVCFAAAPGPRRILACLQVHDDWQDNYSIYRSIQIVGGDESSGWLYLARNWDDQGPRVADAKHEIDLRLINGAREALSQGNYVPFDARGTVLVTAATVGAFHLRTASDHPLELACGSRWVDAHRDQQLDVPSSGTVRMRVSQFDDHRILLELVGHWAKGTIVGTQLIDAAELCR